MTRRRRAQRPSQPRARRDAQHAIVGGVGDPQITLRADLDPHQAAIGLHAIELKIHRQYVTVRARVVQVQGLSAHADYAGVQVPTACAGDPSELLDPRGTWSDGGAYDEQALRLAELFHESFRQFESEVSSAIASAGPPAASGGAS